MNFGRSIPFLAAATPSGGGGVTNPMSVTASVYGEELSGTTLTLTITSVPSAHSLVIGVRTTAAALTIDDATEVSAPSGFGGGQTVKFFRINSALAVGKTSVICRTNGAAAAIEARSYTVDVPNLTSASTAVAANTGTSTGSITTAFTTTADDAVAFLIADFDDLTTPTGAGGWTVLPPFAEWYNTGGYSSGLGTAGAKAVNVTLSPNRVVGSAVQAFIGS